MRKLTMVMSAQARCGIVGRRNIFMGDVKCLNREKGQFFFSPSTIRFFNSRVASPLFNNKYFVTSEKFDAGSPRKYTIRKFDRRTGKIGTEGEFQEYPDRASAIREAKTLR